MKLSKIFFYLSGIIFLITFTICAQDISVHNFIGKPQKEVINKYGKPMHRDDSNPSMLCMFYKSDGNSMIFVADENGVYQAEATNSYSSEKSAKSAIDNFISSSSTNGYSVDTVSVNDFNLHKSGVKVGLQMSENKLTKKYDIRVKANRTTD